MSNELAKELADFKGAGQVIAPAGYGKSHLIACAIGECTKRQLVLTHTYAGVSALRNKMHKLKVPSSKYHLTTIASWALHLCQSYPETAKWRVIRPESRQWDELYAACQTLLHKRFIAQIIASSYAGVFVDEYQDCSQTQHSMLCILAEQLPFRLLGDPLQSIFEFADASVNWEQDIGSRFECIGKLDTPWRWNLYGSFELASWLAAVRDQLMRNQQVDLTGSLPRGISRRTVDIDDFRNPKRLKVFFDLLDSKESVIAIYPGDQQSKNKGHNLAQILSGRFSSIEEVEGKVLFAFIRDFEKPQSASERLILSLNFLKKCVNAPGSYLTVGTMRGEPAAASRATKHPQLLSAANSFLTNDSPEKLYDFFLAISKIAGVSIFRRDLFYRLLKILRTHIERDSDSLSTSAENYHRVFRYSGRPIRHNKLIGTTLLVKGLEFDHAIVLNPQSMTRNELYVALSRGAKSVTILTTAGRIPT